MINLLSTNRKSEIRAARANVILVRYTTIIAVAIVFILSVLYFSYTVLQQTMGTAEARITSNDTKADSATKQQVDALSAKLSDAKTVLDQEVSYATLLTTIGQAMPAGTILESLKIDEASINNSTAVPLVAYAKTEESASLIQQQLRGLPIFSSVELSGTTEDASVAGYPVKVSMTVTFNRSSV